MADLAGRFAQLTYTSYDGGAGRGGWQVKQVTGTLSAAEREAVTSRIDTAFDLEPALPDFPTEEQVLTRPARLAHGLLADGSSVLWHTVDAGRDGSGRPGNVFAHALIDRSPRGQRDCLPIARWRSAGWLRPYGPAAVTAAELTDSVPPNPAIGPASAVAFVCESMQRQQLFRALIDAVAARLEGGLPVVLRTPDHEASVAWISSITHLLPPAAGGDLTWSTHDRLHHLSAQIAAGTDLVCVPLGDGAEVTVPGALMVSADELPDLALTGGSHRFASGQTVAATDLSELAEGVLADPDLADEVLRIQAEVEAAFPGVAVAPVWATAVAVLQQEELAEFHAVAERVVAKRHPASIGDVPWAAALVERAQLQHPPSADEMLHQLQIATPAAPRALATKYCETVLTDGSWQAVPLGSVPSVQAAELASIPEALYTALAEVDALAAADRRGGLPPLMHLGEFLARLAEPGEATKQAVRRLQEIARERQIMPNAAFGSAAGWPAVAPLSAMGQQVFGALLRPCLHRAGDAELRNLSAGMWTAMFPELKDPAHPQFTPADALAEDRAVVPYAALAILVAAAGNQPQRTSDQRTDLVVHAVNTALDAELLTDEVSRALTRDLLAQAPAATLHVSEWLASHPDRISGAGLRSGVIAGPNDVDLLQAALLTAGDPQNPGLADIAQLRLWHLDPSGNWSLTSYLETVGRALTVPGLLHGSVAPDLLAALDVGVVMARYRRSRWIGELQVTIDELERFATGYEAGTAAWLQRLRDYRVIDERWPLGQAFLGYLQAMREGRPPDRVTGIAEQLLDPAAVGSLSATDLRDAAWQLVQFSSAADAESFFADYPKAANNWLRDHQPSGGGFLRMPSRTI